MQQQLFSDPAAAHVFDKLHAQALSLLRTACTDATPDVDSLSVLDVSLPALLSPAHLSPDALSQALHHIGHSASPSALRAGGRPDLERQVRSAVAAAARNHKVTPLQVLAQLSLRYMHVRAAEGAALALVDLSAGAAPAAGALAGEGAGVLAAPFLLRRGVAVSSVRVLTHPGAVLLQQVEPPLLVLLASRLGLLHVLLLCAASGVIGLHAWERHMPVEEAMHVPVVGQGLP